MKPEAATEVRLSPETIRQMDESVWQSHADPWKPLDMLGLPREIWQEYAALTRAAARGYWHGQTGVLAERLKIGECEWLNASRAWHPKGWVPDKIGDTCFGVFEAIVSRAIKGDAESDRWLGRIREVCKTPLPECLSINNRPNDGQAYETTKVVSIQESV